MQRLAFLVVGAIAGLLALSAGRAHADAHARVIEAYADSAFDKATPLRISPIDTAQARNPQFQALAGELYDRLTEQGFKVVEPAKPTDYVVTLEYRTYNTNLRASGESSVDDPSYRMVIVTTWDIRDKAAPKIRWQTAVDSYGISMDSAKVVPVLLKSAATSFGQARTPIGLNKARWCSDGAPTLGHRIAPVCDLNAERPEMNQGGLLTGLTAFTPPLSLGPQ